MKRIRTRLVLFISVLLIVVCSSLGLLASKAASDSLKHSVEQQLTAKAEDSAKIVASSVQARLEAIATIAEIPGLAEMEWNEQFSVLSKQQARLDFKHMGVATPEGDITFTNGTSFNLSGQDYFTRALSGETCMSDPITNPIDNSLSFAFAAPLHDDNEEVQGVVVGFSDSFELTEMIKDITYGESGYAYIINKDGTTIAHPNISLVVNRENNIKAAQEDPSLASMAELEQKMIARESGFGHYDYNGEVKYMGYAPIPGTQWSVGVVADQEEMLASVNTLRNNILLIAVIAILVGCLMSFAVGSMIGKLVQQIAQSLDRIATGDLTVEADEKSLKRKDEFGISARSLQVMVNNLREMVHSISNSSVDVAASSEQLAAQGENIASTMEEVAASSQQIAAGMEEIAASSQEVNASTEEINAALNILQEEAEHGRQQAMEIEKRAIEVEQGAEHSQQNALQISEVIQTKLEKSIADARVVDQISHLAENIAGIADQTNLLALNAAIEAARAGEQGRGFAVVAEEVRKLAEDSSKAVASIQALTRKVQDAINVLIDNSHDALKFMTEDFMKDFKIMVAISKQYKKDSASIYQLMEKMRQNVDQVVASMQEISRSIEATSATIEESTAGAQEIARGSEMAAQAAEEINQASRRMAENAEKLTALIAQFKL